MAADLTLQNRRHRGLMIISIGLQLTVVANIFQIMDHFVLTQTVKLISII